jgi:hypothetical protein
VSTRADGSLALRFATPELLPAEKTAVFELQGKNLKLLIQPMDGQPEELVDVKQEFQTKTPSMRLRAVLYVAWQQAKEPGEFEDFYRHKMEFYINDIKNCLQPA